MFLLPNRVFLIVKYFILFLCMSIFVHLIFCTALSLFGLKKPKKEYQLIESKRKFLFIVPAHNEENVIKATINSLLTQNYDGNLYEVAILADNCTDKTVEIIKKFPQVNLFEYTSLPDEPRGKPHVIAKFIDTDFWYRFDYISFIDADNIVDSNYLAEMNSQLEMFPDFVAIQGYLGIKNISSSFTASGYAAAYFVANRITQLANYRLGWNAAIGGTGFILSVDYLKENGWNPKSYTEDFELQVELSLKNMKTGWNHFAVIYDEKPNTLAASHRQRTRWAQGHWKVAFTSTKNQLFSIFKSKNIIDLMNKINTLFYSYSMIRPPIIFFVLSFSYIIDYRFIMYTPFLFSVIPFWLILEIWNYIVIPAICFVQEGKDYFLNRERNSGKIYLFVTLFFANIYNSVVYMFAQLVGFVSWHRPQNNWKKTVHYTDMEETRK